ncbi:MAG: glycosyltransferase family 4 protein [Anaerolineaceae bacterium]|nr:glycosyltransferase family 4 protein [Anaerolineaceae bacterium]
MRILIALTYYEPNKSGLTIYAVREARALAALGHEVTVLTSQFEPDLPLEEMDQGVRIVRVPVAFKLSKGVVMPNLPGIAWRLLKEADVVNLHLPQIDSALITLFAKWQNKPVVLTYHCYLDMPRGLISRLAGWAVHFTNWLSIQWADAIVHNTRDFAEHSPFLKRYLDRLVVIQPPIVVETADEAEIEQFKRKINYQPGDRIIGMLTRLAAEKGVEYLVEALPEIIEAVPEARVVYGGNHLNVFGEEAYRDRILPLTDALGDRWQFLGIVSDAEKRALFELSNVLVLPSTNSTESFGMVQVEAMTCGTPAVATDLPGVRQPVLSSGMGKIVPIRDAKALGKAVVDVIQGEGQASAETVTKLAAFYAPETVARAYESLFDEVLSKHG